MEAIECCLELSGGVALLIGFGYLIGHILKIENFSAERKRSQQSDLRRSDTAGKESGDFMQDHDF